MNLPTQEGLALHETRGRPGAAAGTRGLSRVHWRGAELPWATMGGYTSGVPTCHGPPWEGTPARCRPYHGPPWGALLPPLFLSRDAHPLLHLTSLLPPTCAAAGFSPDSGEKLGNCLYGSSCAATGLPSGSTPAVIGKIENPDCNYTNFLPCPTGLGVRSVGLNLSYSPDGIIFTGSFFQSTANVSSAGECRTFAQSKICSPFGFKKAGSAGAPAISSRRGQEVAQAPSGGGFYPVFWVYLPKGTWPRWPRKLPEASCTH